MRRFAALRSLSCTRLGQLLPSILLLALSACPAPPQVDVRERAADPAVLPSRTLSADAHRDALQRLIPLAEAAFRADDPVSAARIGAPSLVPRPVGLIGRSARLAASEPARTEATGIDEGALDPADVVVLRSLRFGLDRINDALTRRDPQRSDPTVFYADVRDFLDELEIRLAKDRCQGCAEALSALAAYLQNDPGFSAASRAGVAAAIEDLALLRRRLGALSSRLSRGAAATGSGDTDDGGRQGWSERIDGLMPLLETRAQTLTKIREALDDAPARSWNASPLPLRAGAPRHRLPDAVGAAALARRLSVEEGVHKEPETLLVDVQRNLARFGAMTKSINDADGRPGTGPGTGPITRARCDAEYDHLRAWTTLDPQFESTSSPCARWIAEGDKRDLNNPALVLALLDATIIDPMRRQIRAQELPALGLLAGRWTRHTHLHLRRIMILFRGYDRPDASRLAIERARTDLCLAGVALWEHASLGDEAQLASWSARYCPAQDLATLRSRALGRPRRALRGLGLAAIADEPHEMVGLDRFYWAPLGQTTLLATPPGSHPDRPGGPDAPPSPEPPNQGFKVRIDELNPSTATTPP